MKCDVYIRKELHVISRCQVADHVLSRSIGGPVTHIVVLPNDEEDEVTLREPSENLVCSPSAERRVIIVFATEVFEILNTQDKGERRKAAEGGSSCCQVARPRSKACQGWTIQGPRRQWHSRQLRTVSTWNIIAFRFHFVPERFAWYLQ